MFVLKFKVIQVKEIKKDDYLEIMLLVIVISSLRGLSALYHINHIMSHKYPKGPLKIG